MPPPFAPAVFLVTVLLIRLSVPVPPMRMAPPSAAALLAVLPEKVLFVIVTIDVLKVIAPPPLVPAAVLFEKVLPVIVAGLVVKPNAPPLPLAMLLSNVESVMVRLAFELDGMLIAPPVVPLLLRN